MALINCYECSKEISDKAKQCPSCGAKRKGRSVGAVALNIFLFFLVAGIILFLIVVYSIKSVVTAANDQPSFATEEKQWKPAQVTLNVSAIELSRQYQANEAKADSIFKNHPVRVDGVVTSVSKDFQESTVVALKGVNFLGVLATLKPSQESEALELKKGDSVTVECIAKGEVTGTPMLYECELATP